VSQALFPAQVDLNRYHSTTTIVIDMHHPIIIEAELGAIFIGEKIRVTSRWPLNYGGTIHPLSTVSK